MRSNPILESMVSDSPFLCFVFHFFQTTQNTRGLQFWRPSIHRLNTWLSLDFGHVCTWVRTAARSPTFERTPSGPLKRLSHYALPPSTDAAEPTDMSGCCWSHNNLCQNQVSQKIQEEGWTWGFGATAVNINFEFNFLNPFIFESLKFLHLKLNCSIFKIKFHSCFMYF